MDEFLCPQKHNFLQYSTPFPKIQKANPLSDGFFLLPPCGNAVEALYIIMLSIKDFQKDKRNEYKHHINS